MKNSVVAVMQMEPFGELEYAEDDEEVSPTGVSEHSVLWTRNNPLLIEAVIKAVKRHGVSRVQASVPERPGIHGDQLERWVLGLHAPFPRYVSTTTALRSPFR